MAQHAFTTSRSCTDHIVQVIKGTLCFSLFDHKQHVTEVHSGLNHELDNQDQQCLSSVLQSFDDDRKRANQRDVDGKTSIWLTVMPVAHHHFDLSSVEFWDALALRYHRPLLNMPTFCDGCGFQSSMEHALGCRIGGLVIQRHNEIRDALGDLASIAYVQRSHSRASCKRSR